MNSLRLILFLLVDLIGVSNHLVGQQLIINELMSSNDVTLFDAYGESDDWIEIRNNGTTSVDLAGLFLSDDLSKTAGCKFSDSYPDSTTLDPGEYLIVWADGNPNQGIFHLDFGIKDQETVFLFAINNGEISVLDEVKLPATLSSDYSYSRIPNATGEFIITAQPTPGSVNVDSGFDPLPEVVFSAAGGMHTEAFDLELSCAEAGSTIYFTLDGSVPDENDLVYSGPIHLEDRSDEPNGMSSVITTVAQSYAPWHEPDGLVKKGRVIRAKAFKGDRSSNIATRTFIVDESGVQRYRFPLFSLALDSLSYFHPDTGIYHGGNLYNGTEWESANFAQQGDEWERDVHVEYYVDGMPVITQPAGIRVSGNYTQTANQKSVRLYSRAEYGDSDFDYAFFTDVDEGQYKRLTLRNSGNDLTQAFMRDPFLHSMLKSKDLDLMASQPVIVFVNGEYWGLHYVRERQDGHYLETHYGIDDDRFDILEGNHEIQDGSDEHYVAMMDYITSHDMSADDLFSKLDTMMDLHNFKEYIALEFYIANGDWPYNNIKYWRMQTDGYQADMPPGRDGRWRWFLFDTDMGMGRYGNEPYKNTFDKTFTTHTSWQSRLIRNLVGSEQLPGNEEFRKSFIAEMAHNMNTIFHPDRMLPAVDAWASMIEPEIGEQADRWGSINNVSTWQGKVEVLKEFWLQRPGFFRQQMLDQFDDITDTLNITFDVNGEDFGSLYVNGTKIDSVSLERSGGSLPWTGIYFNHIPIQIRAKSKTGYRFSHWEGIDSTQAETSFIPMEDMAVTAVFEPDPEWGFVLFSEFFFDVPGEMGGDSVSEFIELYNPGPGEYNLAGHQISEGIDFIFPDTARIASHSFIVLARTAATYADLPVPVYQWTDGKLSNNGEMVTLVNGEGDVIDQVYYGYSPPWPVGTDATGYSIEWVQDSASNDSPDSWQRSYTSGGTPGTGTSTPRVRPKLYLNEIFAGSNDLYTDEFGETEDWIEIYNPGADTVWMDGLFLTDTRTAPEIGLIAPYHPDSLKIAPGGFFRFWADDDQNQGVAHLGIKLSKSGESLYLFQSDGFTVIDSVIFGQQTDDASYGRYPDGSDEWEFMHAPTPLGSNLSDNIHKPPLLINEIMASTYGSYIIAGGIDRDWIEIINTGEEPVNAGGLYFSDDPSNPGKYHISSDDPDKTILQPGEFKVFFADGHPEYGHNHLNLELSETGGVVMLSMDSHLGIVTIDSVDYPLAYREVSYGRYPDGGANWYDLIKPSQSAPNIDNPYGLGRIYINELASRNKSSWPDSAGIFSDWIEIYNGNDYAVDLGGLFLTTSYDDPLMWHIPSGTPDSTTVEAESFLVFFANGGYPRSVRNPEFMLSGAGGELALTIPQSRQIIYLDSVTFPALAEGKSWGRLTDANNEWIIFGVPSPDTTNSLGTGVELKSWTAASVRIYPNPSEGYFYMTWGEMDDDEWRLEILSQLGNVLWVKDLVSYGKEPLLVDYPDSFPLGLYFIRLSNQDQYYLGRVYLGQR